MVEIEAYVEELRLMKVPVTDKPEETHDSLIKLGNYFNRATEMQLDIRSESMKSDNGRKKDLLSLLESVKDVKQGLTKTKEIFNTLIREAKYFNGPTPITNPEESNCPWQEEETSQAQDQTVSFPQEDEILFKEE